MATATSPSAVHAFNPVDTANLFSTQDEVESPSLSNPTTRARFEFESGRGNDGTKILMVEWEDDETTRNLKGEWHITWEGKKTVLPAAERSGSDVNRLYFLLPPGTAVPSHITLTRSPADRSQQAVIWRTNPLPAIYPPELGASARTAGKKGVLHTLWAKKRLQELQKEIEAEAKDNVESVGLEMAVQEKEWIEQNFGVTAKPLGLSISSDSASTPPASPISPRSPGGGRLAEKLKGLKLGTSASDLTSRQSPSNGPAQNPLSPEGSDVAVSSFAAIKGNNPSMLAAKAPQHPQGAQTGQSSLPARRIEPPQSVLSQQQHQATGMGSLNSFAGGMVPAGQSRDDDNEEGLFALPISPRSPEMGKSPFSFAATDTMKYVQSERAA